MYGDLVKNTSEYVCKGVSGKIGIYGTANSVETHSNMGSIITECVPKWNEILEGWGSCQNQWVTMEKNNSYR